MALIVHGGGGGSVSSSDLTAIKSNVLEGTTYLGQDTNDEGGTGTMANYGSSSKSGYPNYVGRVESSSVGVNPVVRLRIPANGYYTTNNYLYTLSSNLGNANLDQVLSGRQFTSTQGLLKTGTMPDNSTTSSNGTVPGIKSNTPGIPTRQGSGLQYNLDTDGVGRISICPPKGYYPGTNSFVNATAASFGDVGAGSVLEGRTFTSNAGLKVEGKMINHGGETLTANPTITSGKITMKVPFPASENNGGYVNNNTVFSASIPNLSAANIKKGVSVGGITGTFEGYVASTGTVYNNGVWGSGFSKSTIVAKNSNAISCTYDTNCIIVKDNDTYWDSRDMLILFSANNPLNASAYSQIVIQASGQGHGSTSTTNSNDIPSTLYIYAYSVNGTQLASSSKVFADNDAKFNLTLSLASITQSVYFEIYSFRNRHYSGGVDQYMPSYAIYNITLS